MGIYYSPNGNPEVWDIKPNEYFTEMEWLAANPVAEPELELPSLEEARTAKLAELMTSYEAAFAAVNAAYPGIEREGWFLQREEAQKVLAGGESAILKRWVAERGAGETLQAFAEAILANYAKWSALYAALTPIQQRIYAEINAMDSAEAVQAYQISLASSEGA